MAKRISHKEQMAIAIELSQSFKNSDKGGRPTQHFKDDQPTPRSGFLGALRQQGNSRDRESFERPAFDPKDLMTGKNNSLSQAGNNSDLAWLMSSKPVEQPKPAQQSKLVEQPKPVEKPKPAKQSKPAEKPNPTQVSKPADKPKPAEKPKSADKPKPTDKLVPTENPMLGPKKAAAEKPVPIEIPSTDMPLSVDKLELTQKQVNAFDKFSSDPGKFIATNGSLDDFKYLAALSELDIYFPKDFQPQAGSIGDIVRRSRSTDAGSVPLTEKECAILGHRALDLSTWIVIEVDGQLKRALSEEAYLMDAKLIATKTHFDSVKYMARPIPVFSAKESAAVRRNAESMARSAAASAASSLVFDAIQRGDLIEGLAHSKWAVK